MRPAAVTRVNVMENTEGAVHYTFADNFAPYFLLVFCPIVVIFCLFGIFHTYLTTEDFPESCLNQYSPCYFGLLVPTSIPVFVFFMYFNWMGLKFFTHN
ncbi:Phosphatidylinositol N-acetylglucosaminyltransferase subunit Y [Stylophora pistillata]|uniref:Phosphatidylinositol N-acetylglucosaminyltransferase subunit Y n=1 Tax=Stylophora pistillata TaxID=50429 RepID=A0A2B4SL82_STYPI|nr:Phosphatidylinositol N-acetylglucosaminyltransferase subunit Y [Stylophora pistillata]